MSPIIHYVVLGLLTAGTVLFSIRTLRNSMGGTGTVRTLVALGVFAAFSLGFVFALSLAGSGPARVLADTVGVIVITAATVFALVGIQYAALSTGNRVFGNTGESWKTDAVVSLAVAAVVFIVTLTLISKISG